jgi:hypothetical protein
MTCAVVDDAEGSAGRARRIAGRDASRGQAKRLAAKGAAVTSRLPRSVEDRRLAGPPDPRTAGAPAAAG